MSVGGGGGAISTGASPGFWFPGCGDGGVLGSRCPSGTTACIINHHPNQATELRVVVNYLPWAAAEHADQQEMSARRATPRAMEEEERSMILPSCIVLRCYNQRCIIGNGDGTVP